MTEAKKKGIGIGLIVSIALVVLLAISNLLVYSSLQSQINTLNTQKNSLQNQVSNLQTDKTNLENNVTALQNQVNTLQTDKNNLQTQVNNLQTQVNNLKAPQLHLVNFESRVTTVWLGTDYVTVKGTIFNSGSNSASNVVFTVRLYNSASTLLKTEQITFGTILGKSYENFNTDIGAEGVSYITTSLTHD